MRALGLPRQLEARDRAAVPSASGSCSLGSRVGADTAEPWLHMWGPWAAGGGPSRAAPILQAACRPQGLWAPRSRLSALGVQAVCSAERTSGHHVESLRVSVLEAETEGQVRCNSYATHLVVALFVLVLSK